MFAYLVTGPSGKRYVGITSLTVAQRWRTHLLDSRRASSRSALHAAIRLYGADAFKVEELASFSTWSEAAAFEVQAISRYGTFGDGGYNLTLGGDGKYGYRASAETRRRMSDSQRDRVISDEHRANLSLAHQRRTPEQRATLAAKIKTANAKRTPEEKIRISETIAASKRGKKRDASTVAKIADAKRGKLHSAATKAKMSASHQGFTHTELSRARMSELAQARREQTAAAMREIWRQRKEAQNHAGQNA